MSVVSVALGTLFVLAAAGKFTADRSLIDFLAALGVPERLRVPLDRAVPYAEAALGAWLVTGLAPVPAAVAALVLAAGFACIHVFAAVSHVSQSCRCFGRADTEMSAAIGVVRSLGILMLAAAAVAVASMLGGAGSRAWVSVLAAGVLAGLSFHLSFLVWNEVAALIRRDRKVALAIAETRRKHLEEHAGHVA